MATAKHTGQPARRSWLRIVLAIVLVIVGAAYLSIEMLGNYAQAGTAYAAKNTCSCRYLAGRDINSCQTDFIPGMETIFVSDDEAEREVTAFVPLVASATARFDEEFGCVLEPWQG